MDREKVIKGLEQFRSDFKPFCGGKADWERFDAGLALLKEQEAVVRCKDCKAWKQYDDMNLGECELYPEYNKMGDWFCNFGERK